MDHIEWTIPGDEAKAQGFGPLRGGDEAWTALELAMLDGWVVAITAGNTQATMARELVKRARAKGRVSLLKKKEHEATLFAWWS